MCRKIKRQVLDEEWQRTSIMLPIVDVTCQRGREVAERRARDSVRMTLVRLGQGWQPQTDDSLFFAVHFDIGLHCAASDENSLKLCVH